MLFLEPWFWIFAGVAVPAYWLCPARLKLYWLLLASAVFQYHFAGPAGMAPIIVLAALTYVSGLGAARLAAWRLAGAVGVLLVGALAFYKYAGLVLSSATGLLAHVHVSLPARLEQWHSPAAPLGISFFTFES